MASPKKDQTPNVCAAPIVSELKHQQQRPNAQSVISAVFLGVANEAGFPI
jgi:hypothetical protein